MNVVTSSLSAISGRSACNGEMAHWWFPLVRRGDGDAGRRRLRVEVELSGGDDAVQWWCPSLMRETDVWVSSRACQVSLERHRSNSSVVGWIDDGKEAGDGEKRCELGSVGYGVVDWISTEYSSAIHWQLRVIVEGRRSTEKGSPETGSQSS